MSQTQTIPTDQSALPAETICPNCGRGVERAFYSVDSIPVHSCLLLPTRQEAMDFPRGDLLLGFCQSCGFIFNAIFDGSRHTYSTGYEEAQGFSPRFNRFQDVLVEWLVDGHGLRNKRVLEIGCGKGDFLVRLCEAGGNIGVGIDPSYIPQRTSTQARVHFIQDFYSEKYTSLRADAICCRHTLEHIGPTRDFLRLLRRSIGRPETLVFFEVPDVRRVLREGAFWDIYYEHCSYFSPGSLARLFRAEGFEILELYLDFDDQYILLMARPCGTAAPGRDLRGTAAVGHGLEDDLGELANEVEQFERVSTKRIADWRRQIEQSISAGRRIAIWGSGSKAVAFLTTLKADGNIACVTDINPYRHGKCMPGCGHQIVPPKALAQYKPDDVIVMNPVYLEEIRQDLEGMGLHPRLLPV